MSDLKLQINDAMKSAMRAKEKQRLATIRQMMAEIKRVEVDERVTLEDTRILALLDKMCKQRRDSLNQFAAAGREDLAAIESMELDVIQSFLPAQLTQEEIQALIQQAIAASGASGMQDMGKVMAELKPKMQGRADMGQVSGLVKQALN